MSEHYAYVACTCWRDGTATTPPIEASFTIGHYGHLLLPDGSIVEDRPDVLYDWAVETGCPTIT